MYTYSNYPRAGVIREMHVCDNIGLHVIVCGHKCICIGGQLLVCMVVVMSVCINVRRVCTILCVCVV